MSPNYFLGIDGGGTKCKVRLENQSGDCLAEYTSGPANPMRNYALAIKSLNEGIKGAFESAGFNQKQMSKTHAVVGLAGLNIPSCAKNMMSWQHPFKSIQLVTDLRIACAGAHLKESGAIVIIGTGSSGVVCVGEKDIEYGGHGFGLGDKGSGAWFGMQAVQQLLEMKDGLVSPSPLMKSVQQKINLSSTHEIIEQYHQASPSIFAGIAPLVFEHAEAGDPSALSIVKDGADYIIRLCDQMLLQAPSRFSLIGGLSAKIYPYLPQRLQVQLAPAKASPEVGAILIARQQNVIGKLSA